MTQHPADVTASRNDASRRGIRQAAVITAAGLLTSALAGMACYLALPEMVTSTNAGAPPGTLQPKGEALSFLLWEVPVVAVLVVALMVGITAMGPACLTLRRPEAKEFWSRPENWPTARALVLRQVAIAMAGVSLLTVLATCVGAGAQAWGLGQRWWVWFALCLVALIGWLVRRVTRLEHPHVVGR